MYKYTLQDTPSKDDPSSILTSLLFYCQSAIMVHSRKALLAALPMVAAYPWAMEASSNMRKRQQSIEPPAREPLFLSGRSNTSPLGAPVFDAEEQFVDVRQGSGHEFRSPTQGQVRGQCPGLNAASNHA